MAEPRFTFRLNALLLHRRQLEKERQREVAGAQQNVNALVQRIHRMRDTIASETRDLSASHLVGRLDMQYIAHGKRYVGTLQVQVVVTIQDLAAAEQALAAAKSRLLAAARARKVIEKLREKAFARWRAELDRKEAEQLDDIGTNLALRFTAEEASLMVMDADAITAARARPSGE